MSGRTTQCVQGGCAGELLGCACLEAVSGVLGVHLLRADEEEGWSSEVKSTSWGLGDSSDTARGSTREAGVRPGLSGWCIKRGAGIAEEKQLQGSCGPAGPSCGGGSVQSPFAPKMN